MKKLKFKKPKSDEPTKKSSSARITNDTIAEHREKILAGGRKFKYPVQYSRHKILINTLIIFVVVALLFFGFGWWMLYKQQVTDDFFYNATKVAPVPVASVDGTQVRYSDYLRRLRSSMTYLQRSNEISANKSEADRQIEFLKRQELDEVEKDAYANSLAAANGVEVTDEQVNDFITRERESAKSSLSESAFEKAVLQDFYGWTLDDYRKIVKDRLTRRQVAFVIDQPAEQKAKQIKQWLDGGSDFAEIAKQHSDDDTTKMTGGKAGSIKTNTLDSNGLIAAAKKLEPGQVSPIIQGVDGYYIIKLNSKTDSAVNYSLIKVDLNEFDRQFEQLRSDGKVKEFIKIDASAGQTQTQGK